MREGHALAMAFGEEDLESTGERERERERHTPMNQMLN
jgi:hypothetical protein